jgi:hypothetical protein
MRRFVLALSLACCASAQVPIANPGFEQDTAGVPTGWFMPKPGADAGFKAEVTAENCRTGAHCALLTGVANPPPSVFGNLMQTLSAAGYALRRIRLRAAIRVEGADTQAQMWLRLDRADNGTAFLDNMGTRPVKSSEWKTYDIETNVPEDAARMALGVMIFGPGKAWIDDFNLETLDEIRKEPPEAPRPIMSRGLIDLTAFTRLYGYVRFFHPSDRAAGTDWETFAIAGVRRVEGAPSDADLIVRLRDLFQPVAPTVQIWATGKRPPAQAVTRGPEIVRYQHKGVGLPSSLMPTNNIYSSEHVRKPAAGQPMPKPFEAQIVSGISVSVPVALYADSGGTLPHIPGDTHNLLYERTAEDRSDKAGRGGDCLECLPAFLPLLRCREDGLGGGVAEGAVRRGGQYGRGRFRGYAAAAGGGIEGRPWQRHVAACEAFYSSSSDAGLGGRAVHRDAGTEGEIGRHCGVGPGVEDRRQAYRSGFRRSQGVDLRRHCAVDCVAVGYRSAPM